jgi:hypothetical protein
VFDALYRGRAGLLLLGAFQSVFAYFSVLLGFLIDQYLRPAHPVAWRDPINAHLMESPFWALGIIFAFSFGCITYLLAKSSSSLLAWPVPALLLAWNLISWSSQAGSTWQAFFASGCAEGCLYQILVTAPFYAAVGYSFGALIVSAALTLRRAPASV